MLPLSNPGLGLKIQVKPRGLLPGIKTAAGSKTQWSHSSREWVKHTSGPTKEGYLLK